MALNLVPVAVPFGPGVDTKSDPKTAPAGRLITLENGVFDRGITIKKRNGYEALGSAVTGAGTSYSDARALAVRGTEPVLLTSTSAYSYQASSDTWDEIGPVASVAMSDESVAHTGTNQTTPDAATNGGVTLIAWEDSRGGVWWTLQESEGGRVLRAPEQADASGQRPRCVAVGTVLHLLWANSNEIRIIVVNPAEPTASLAYSILTTDLYTTVPAFDAAPTDRSGSPAVLAWATSTGYRVGYIDQSGVIGSPVTGHPSAADFAGVVDAGGIAVAYRSGAAATAELAVVIGAAMASGTGDMESRGLDGALSSIDRVQTTLTAAIERIAIAPQEGIGIAGTFEAVAWCELTGASGRDHRVEELRCDYGSPAIDAGQVLRGCGLASSGFVDDGVAAVWVAHDVTYFATYLCMRWDIDGHQCVARALPGPAYGLPPRAHLPHVETDASDSRVHRWCASWQQQLPAGDGEAAVFAEIGIRRVTLDFDAATAYQTAQLGRSLYIAGACPLRYDGDTIAEAGWHYAPDDVAAPTQGTTGALTQTATYVYRFVYEEIDAQGEIHQGPTSVGTEVPLTGSNDSLTFAIPTYRHTSRRRVRIGVFRTEANDASGGLYRVSSLDPSATGANGYVANDPTVDTVTFTDEMSDATLITKEPLYTNGGIPSNDPTGSGMIIAAGKNRLFYNDPSDPLLVRYTHEIVDGYAAEFSLELAQKVDPYGGAITALAVLDQNVIVFKRSAIFAMSGTGPLRDPLADAASGFSAPGLITSDVGCTAPSSIAVTPAGLVFQSAKGIYQLGRGLDVSYVGAPVEGFKDQTVKRATLIEDRTQIVFLCDTGKTLLYDYFFGQWSTYTNHTGLDAALIAGTYHYLRTDGRVFRETVGEYRDDNSQIRLVLETAWIKLQGYLQGMARFYHLHLIGERKSAHTIRFRYQTEFMNSWSAPREVDWTTDSGDVYGAGEYGEGVYGGEPSEVYRWRVHLGEVGSAVRFRFEDVEPTGEFGAGYELNEMLLECGAKRAAIRPYPATRTT